MDYEGFERKCRNSLLLLQNHYTNLQVTQTCRTKFQDLLYHWKPRLITCQYRQESDGWGTRTCVTLVHCTAVGGYNCWSPINVSCSVNSTWFKLLYLTWSLSRYFEKYQYAKLATAASITTNPTNTAMMTPTLTFLDWSQPLLYNTGFLSSISILQGKELGSREYISKIMSITKLS